MLKDEELMSEVPPRAPNASLVWTAIVEVGDRVTLGASRGGQRFMIPILGGRFYAAKGRDGLCGQVLPGGADRQFLRSDGIKELDALYEMETDCGTVITVRNRVIIDESANPERYAMSVIDASAPDGQFEWLNRRVLLGTLQLAQAKRQAVIIRAWEILGG